MKFARIVVSCFNLHVFGTIYTVTPKHYKLRLVARPQK